MIKFKLLIFISLLSISLHAQTIVFAYSDYFNQILANNPIVKQASLLSDQAQAELLMARGGFDPKLDFDINRKIFKKTVYYNYQDYGLKIPTWYGPTLMTGFQQNAGQFINPAEFTPPEGLWYVGIDYNVFQNIIIDERRAAVKQAEIMQQSNDAERIKVINKVLLSAAKDYWSWYFYYHKYLVKSQSYNLAKERLNGVKNRVLGGDLPVIDSIEASLTVRERAVELQDALNDYQNSALLISNYLWTPNLEPLEITENTIPQNIDSLFSLSPAQENELISYAESFHPEIRKIEYKKMQLRIENKLRMQQMMPSIQLTGKYISTPKNRIPDGLNTDYLFNNNRIYIGILQPLFLRKERGKYQMTRIKLNQIDLEYEMARREITNNIRSAANDLDTYRQLVANQINMIASAEALLRAEKNKFDLGESTIFLVNSRESKLLDSQVKLYDLKAKYEKAKAILNWSVGKF